MEIKILGAHRTESNSTRLVSLLIDDILALDAGSLTSGLSLDAQKKIRSVLITHHHFDHVRDLVTLGLNAGSWSPVEIYALKDTIDVVCQCLFDGRLHMNFAEFPCKENPSLQFNVVAPQEEKRIYNYKVTPFLVRHSVPSVGFHVVSSNGRAFFYTGDTGVGIHECWKYISPELLITEVSGINRQAESLRTWGHLCGDFLKQELEQILKIKECLPVVVVVHMDPELEKQIKEEVALVAAELNADISIGYEGMQINI